MLNPTNAMKKIGRLILFACWDKKRSHIMSVSCQLLELL
jgi:hypothetical protein